MSTKRKFYEVTVYEKVRWCSTVFVEASSKKEAHDAVLAAYRTNRKDVVFDWEETERAFDGSEADPCERAADYKVVHGNLRDFKDSQ